MDSIELTIHEIDVMIAELSFHRLELEELLD